FPFSYKMLSIVSTPIGNLKDISYRAVDTLKSCDVILCEDTRHSKRLLQHYQIDTPTKSYHQFNEARECEAIIKGIKSGKHYCLVSDAGTPTISDPGYRLVRACIKAGIDIDSVPGPCAAILSLTLSGLSTDRFQFIGFLPKKESAVRKELFNLLYYSGTSICYESPKRLIKLIKIIQKIDPDRSIVIARELTKRFQEILRGNPEDILTHFKEKEVKGEIVILIGHNIAFDLNHWRKKPLEETLKGLQETFDLSRMEAIKTLAALREQSKREIYKQIETRSV
ncbi:MAG: 16S rRNA (cytidine(1402)-2'-O)-methyltransferase, partial [Chlamydiota bacterium]